MKFLQYQTISESDTCMLDQNVTELLAKGWQPLGAPYVWTNLVCQAMVSEQPPSAESAPESVL